MFFSRKPKIDFNSFYLKVFFMKLLGVGIPRYYKLKVRRDQVISGRLIREPVFVHQGKTWSRVRINKYKVGYKFGMFSATKKPFYFRAKQKKRKRDSRR